MLQSDRLKNYFTKINSANLTATRVNRGRWSMSLLLAKRAGPRLVSWVWTWCFNNESTVLSNAFNYHFSTIASKLASEIPFNNGSSFQEYISGLTITERFQLVSTESNQVLSLFKTLNKSKGAGLDGLSSRLILDCADLIAPHISITFNSSLANGIFPDDWKSATVTLPFKHGKEAIWKIIVQFQLSP